MSRISDDVIWVPIERAARAEFNIVDGRTLLAKFRTGGDLSDAEASALLAWIEAEVLDGAESPEEALVKVLTLPATHRVAAFHAIHDQSTHGNRRGGLRDDEPRASAAGYRRGMDVDRSTATKIADWFRQEFFPTGSFDVGDFLLAFFTLPARVFAPTQERLLGLQVFHLQGEHDQQSHAGGRRLLGDRTPEEQEEWHAETYEAVYDAYNTTITDKAGNEYLVETDITMDVGLPWAGINGIISHPETGEIVGQFNREVDFEDSLVINKEFAVEPNLQGMGIGTAFLDATEGALRDMGIQDSFLTAAGIGKVAWAARGYRVADADRQRAGESWAINSRRMVQDYDFTDEQVRQVEAVTRSWDDGADVYPGDLLAIDKRFSTVLLDSDRVFSYDATKPLNPAPRQRPWENEDQGTLFAARVFRL